MERYNNVDFRHGKRDCLKIEKAGRLSLPPAALAHFPPGTPFIPAPVRILPGIPKGKTVLVFAAKSSAAGSARQGGARKRADDVIFFVRIK